MTTLSRGLASLRRAAHHSRSLHLLTPASAIARPFTTQTSRHAEGSGSPDFKNIKFPSFPLGIAPKAKSANERRLDQVQKLETSTALPSNFPTIPPIPPRPAPGLTPWITDEEAHQYLAPLLARQWSVARYRDPKSKTKVHYQLLSKLFVLRREKDATEFSMGVSEIITKMAHHPTVHKIQGKEVVFRVFTHDAYVMEKDGKPIVTPGITMHDIRLAMRIEKLWDKFWEKGRARLPRQGWTFTGRKRLTVRYWGIREAKLVPEWRQDLNASRRHLREKFLQAQGKKASNSKRLQRPRKQTPRWKKMKWRNQSKRKKVDAVGENTETGASV